MGFKSTFVASGFTLVELMVSMAILMVLFTLVSINLTRLPSASSQIAALETLMGDIKYQQNSAMAGYLQNGVSNENFGIHFESGSYILFKGDSYDPLNSTNFTVNLDDPLAFSGITWPGSTIVFERGSGDILEYSPGNDSFSITNSVTSEVETVRLNKYGAAY